MLKVVKIKHKWITVEIDGEQVDILKNVFTSHYENGDLYKYHAEIISRNGDGTIICSHCRKSLLYADTTYDGWKESLKSRFCRHCGASFINVLDTSKNQRFEEFSNSTLQHMGFIR